MKLRSRELGNLGIHVPPVSLGTVKLGRNTQVKYPQGFEPPGDKEVTDLLETAQELGINLIDTAPAYGASEERLGHLLPGERTNWIISTKAGEFFERGVSRFDFSAKAIDASVTQSLRNLRMEYLDMVLIHSDGNDLQILQQTDAIHALQRRREKGDLGLVGFSTKTVEGGLAALDVVDVLMVTLNKRDRSQLPVIEQASRAGKGILLKKVFDSGHADTADSLSFALSQPGVHSAVLGTINPVHLKENADMAARICN